MKRIVIILIVSLFLSCERENESPGSNLNTFISVDPNNWWIDNGEYFYFVTTLDGELIAFKKLEDHKINTLYFENDITPNKFNVHRLYVPNDSDHRYLKSYFNTNQTSFTDNQDCEQLPDLIGDCKIHITGPSYETYILSSPSGGMISTVFYQNNPINRTIETDLYQEHSFLFTFLKKDQQYYYKYFFDLNPDENYSFELDPTTMDTDFDIQLLNAPEEMFFLEDCKIKNVILGKLCYYSYCRLYSEINGDSTTLSIFNTPINPGKYFQSRIHLQVKDSKEYIYLKNGNLPGFIPPLGFDISASNLDYDNISITTTGSFDFINGYYRGENYPYKSWSFNSDNPDLIKFPDIPAEITELYPSITIDTFFDTLTVEANISLIEYSEYENYAEYLADYGYIRDLGENSALQNLSIKNYE